MASTPRTLPPFNVLFLLLFALDVRLYLPFWLLGNTSAGPLGMPGEQDGL